jgi:hypothetical protein
MTDKEQIKKKRGRNRSLTVDAFSPPMDAAPKPQTLKSIIQEEEEIDDKPVVPSFGDYVCLSLVTRILFYRAHLFKTANRRSDWQRRIRKSVQRIAHEKRSIRGNQRNQAYRRRCNQEYAQHPCMSKIRSLPPLRKTNFLHHRRKSIFSKNSRIQTLFSTGIVI